MQFTIATARLVNVSAKLSIAKRRSFCNRVEEDMSKIVSLEITFKGQFNKANKVLSFDTSTSTFEITSLEILSKSLQ